MDSVICTVDSSFTDPKSGALVLETPEDDMFDSNERCRVVGLTRVNRITHPTCVPELVFELKGLFDCATNVREMHVEWQRSNQSLTNAFAPAALGDREAGVDLRRRDTVEIATFVALLEVAVQQLAEHNWILAVSNVADNTPIPTPLVGAPARTPEKKLLYDLRISIDEEEVAMLVYEGDSAEVVAQTFVAKYGLNESMVQTLSEGIAEHHKAQLQRTDL